MWDIIALVFMGLLDINGLLASWSTTIHEDNREEDEQNLPLQISSALTYEVWKEDELNLPCGYRFSPDEDELIIHYLANKILGRQLPADIIRDIDLYKHDPNELPIDEFTYGKPNEAYFFTHTELPKSTTNNGYWKASGEDVQIFSDNVIVGFKKILFFYEKKEKKVSGGIIEKVSGGKETSWIIYEYRINPEIIPVEELNEHIRNEMERRVVCRIHNGSRYSKAKSRKDSLAESYQIDTWERDIPNYDDGNDKSSDIEEEPLHQ